MVNRALEDDCKRL